ncbi:hypothetical protein [Haliangium sp.]|uniref:hypothetical protein n=1 Tax=Haliangium sp. TaxID=2663208 RepID=UPI003D0B6527
MRWPLAYYLLEANDLGEAQKLLTRRLAGGPCARARASAWPTSTSRRTNTPSPASLYRRALLLDPYDAFERIRDPEVRALPDIARYEFELEAEPRASSAVAGMDDRSFADADQRARHGRHEQQWRRRRRRRARVGGFVRGAHLRRRSWPLGSL